MKAVPYRKDFMKALGPDTTERCHPWRDERNCH